MWKAEYLSDKPGYVAEQIPKWSAEGTACFLLAFHGKMCEDRDKLREDLLIEKKVRLGDLGNSQSIQTAKYVKIRRIHCQETLVWWERQRCGYTNIC